MRDVRTAVRLAEEVGAELGCGAVLQRTLPSRGAGRAAAMNAAIPGPRGAANVRVLADVGRNGLVPALQRLARRYGPISAFTLGTQRLVFVDDAGLVEQMLVTRQHAFSRDVGAALASDLLGEGLLTTEDPPHLARRRLMAPAFHRARIASYADAIVTEAERCADRMTGEREVDIGGEMTALTLAAVGAALFGADVRGSTARVAAVLGRFTGRGNLFALGLLLAAPALDTIRRRRKKTPTFFRAERAELEAIVAPLIAQRRAEARGNDLLSLLLDARDDGGRGLDDEALRSEVVTLVLAGHETTSTALTWAWQLLARHPDVERTMHAELERVLGGRAPTFDDLGALRYTTHVFNETMRLYPPVPAFGRRPLAAIELGGYTIAKGTSIYVSPYVTQRNPAYFDDPDTFRPERWHGEAPPKFAYFPFGGGSKMCIGESFAQLEGVLALATIGRRLALRSIAGNAVEPSRGALLRPERPIVLVPERLPKAS